MNRWSRAASRTRQCSPGPHPRPEPTRSAVPSRWPGPTAWSRERSSRSTSGADEIAACDAEPTAVAPASLPNARPALLACILASSLVGMDSLMTTVALPSIAIALDVGLSVQQWIVAAFLLAVASLLLVGGALGDVFGRWRIFGIGTAGFGLAALVCALAPNAPLLITGRLLQGAMAALLLPSVLAVITAAFDDARRSTAIATWSAWSGLSVIAGPLIGGVLIETVSWRAIYFVEAPCALAVVLLILRAAPRASGATGGGVDVLGAVLAVPAIGGPAFYLIQGPALGWTHPATLGALAIGILTVAGFLLWERRAVHPLLPLVLFKVRSFTMINVVTFVLYGALISCGTYTVLFLQDNLGYAPAVAGLVSAVPVMVLFVLSGRFGSLADRYGGRLFIAGGSVVAGLGMLLLLRAEANASLWTVILPSVLVHGVGLAMVVAPLTSGVMSAVDETRAGAASGINNAVARAGSMLAIAVIGVVISLQFSSQLDSALGGRALSPEMERAVESARERPLSDTPVAGLAPDDRSVLEPVLADASVGAFHLAVGVMGGLALLAGVLAFAGIGRSAVRYDAEGTLGCPITGVRGHRDSPGRGAAMPHTGQHR